MPVKNSAPKNPVKTQKRKKRPATNPTRLVVIILAIILLLGAAAFIIIKTVLPNVNNEVVEQGSEFEEIIAQGESEMASLDSLEYYEVDGDRYQTGDMLSAWIDNGWQPLDGNEETEVDPMNDTTVIMTRDDESLLLVVMNMDENNTLTISDCVITSFSVYESQGQSVESISVNGEQIWKIDIHEANSIFPSQSEDAGESFFYFSIPEEQQTAGTGNVSLTGWSVYAGSEAGDGTMDNISFSLDYVYY